MDKFTSYYTDKTIQQLIVHRDRCINANINTLEQDNKRLYHENQELYGQIRYLRGELIDLQEKVDKAIKNLTWLEEFKKEKEKKGDE